MARAPLRALADRGLLALEHRLERRDALAPERLHPVGVRRVGQSRVLDGHGALALVLGQERDVDARAAVAPVETGAPGPRGRALPELVVGQPARAGRGVDERVVELLDRHRHGSRGGDREALHADADEALEGLLRGHQVLLSAAAAPRLTLTTAPPG